MKFIKNSLLEKTAIWDIIISFALKLSYLMKHFQGLNYIVPFISLKTRNVNILLTYSRTTGIIYGT